MQGLIPVLKNLPMIDNSPISYVFTRPAALRVVKERKSVRDAILKKRFYLICKRCFDISFSLLVITGILSWLVPVMAILICLDSPGPVFFLQRRVGRAGRSFTCLKFRTMFINKEQDDKPALPDDNRITRIGRLLRKSNLDEFPQFFNVLMGSMSIIGPRPHMHADCHNFSLIQPGYKIRNLLKPGITGLAQVKGFHGPVLNRESILERFYWDKYYVTHLSFFLDVRIFSQTVLERSWSLATTLLTESSHFKEEAC